MRYPNFLLILIVVYYGISFMKDTSTSGTYKVLFLALMFIVVVGGAALFLTYNEHEKAVEEHVQEALRVDQIPATRENVIGNYSVVVDDAGVEMRYTGAIDEDSLGNLVLSFYNEFEPKKFMVHINEDGTLFSESLGTGSMSFKSSIGKIIITFEKEDTKCTLTR